MLLKPDGKPYRENDLKELAPGVKLLMKGCAFIIQGLNIGSFTEKDLKANKQILEKALGATNDLLEGIEEAKKGSGLNGER